MKIHLFYLSTLMYSTSAFFGLTNLAYSGKYGDKNDLARAIVASKPFADDVDFPGVIKEITPVMYVEASRLPSIAQYGLFNQHQTKSTRGCTNLVWRSERETSFYSHLGAGKSPLPSGLAPKYGTLSYRVEGVPARKMPEKGASQYGDIMLIFKPDVKQRMTYSLNDSLAYIPMSHSDVSPMSDVSSLEKFQRGHEPYSVYLESQYLGDLSLDDVREIWVTKEVTPDIAITLKEISSEYHIPIMIGKKVETEDHYIQVMPTLSEDYTVPPSVDSLPRRFEWPSREMLLSRHAAADDCEKSIIVSILAQQGDISGLGEEIRPIVKAVMDSSRRGLEDLVIAPDEKFIGVRAAALHQLLSEKWPDPAFTTRMFFPTQLLFETVVRLLRNPTFLIELKKYYPTASTLERAIRGQLLPLDRAAIGLLDFERLREDYSDLP